VQTRAAAATTLPDGTRAPRTRITGELATSYIIGSDPVIFNSSASGNAVVRTTRQNCSLLQTVRGGTSMIDNMLPPPLSIEEVSRTNVRTWWEPPLKK